LLKRGVNWTALSLGYSRGRAVDDAWFAGDAAMSISACRFILKRRRGLSALLVEMSSPDAETACTNRVNGRLFVRSQPLTRRSKSWLQLC